MIYIHVPFCKRFCTYCDFFSELVTANDGQLMHSYADALCQEIQRRKDELTSPDSFLADTLYFGGGTPSVLPMEDLFRILMELQELGHGCPYEEFTMEVNPEDIVEKGPDYLRNLRALGVSRISIGIQSLDDDVLRWMNRRHDAARARKAFEMAQEAGFNNISVDLIFGISLLDKDVWARTVDEVIALGPEHVSCYQLTVEGDCALAQMVASGQYVEANEEQCREQYDILCDRLNAAGYGHYEISNFALPGYEARHNSGYWARLPYIGLGPSAHSFNGSDRRFWNSNALTEYTSSEEILDPDAVRVETMMLALRTSRGIEEKWLRAHTDAATLDNLIENGALIPAAEDGYLRIPEDRFFVSDEIIRELI